MGRPSASVLSAVCCRLVSTLLLLLLRDSGSGAGGLAASTFSASNVVSDLQYAGNSSDAYR